MEDANDQLLENQICYRFLKKTENKEAFDFNLAFVQSVLGSFCVWEILMISCLRSGLIRVILKNNVKEETFNLDLVVHVTPSK